MNTLIATYRHIQAQSLSVGIYKTEKGDFYFDKNGDYYNKAWCKDPFLQCKLDAIHFLNEKYNGTYNQETYGEYSEKVTFKAIFR